MLFRLDDVAKEFAAQVLFRDISVQCNPGNRIGLIGRNGTGKTTLFDLIQGRIPPDQGRVTFRSGLSVSRIEQRPDFPARRTVLEEALTVFDDMAQTERRLAHLEHEMTQSADEIETTLAEEYESLRLRMQLHGGYDYRARTESVLLGVGFEEPLLQGPCGHLSGGQLNRLLAAKALLRPCDLLLLDEPTNHLDLPAILWLTDYLKSLGSAYLVISHDRRFLDEVTDETWEIENRKLYRYTGGYTRSRRLRQERRELERKEYEKQQEWKSRTEDFIRRNIAGQKTKQAQSRRLQLQRTEWLEAPQADTSSLRLRIDEGRRGGALAFRLDRLDVGYPGVELLKQVTLEVRRGERIGILGGNGSGKSTLLKTLTDEIPPLSGTVEWGPHNELSYFSQNPSLGEDTGNRTVYDALRQVEPHLTDLQLRSYAALFLFRGDDIHKPLEGLSGGERSRLALARLLREPANILILDEPTNHLDITARESLEGVLAGYGGTLITVSHDLYFLARVVDRFYRIADRRLIPLRDPSEIGLPSSGSLLAQKDGRRSPALSSEPTSAGNRISKNKLRQLQDSVKRLESRIAAIEAEKSKLERALSQADLDFRELHEQARRHQELSQELAELYRAWEEQSSEVLEAEG